MVQAASDETGEICPHCRDHVRHTFYLPARARLSANAPLAVCHFCFIRLVGIVPTRSRRAPRGVHTVQPTI